MKTAKTATIQTALSALLAASGFPTYAARAKSEKNPVVLRHYAGMILRALGRVEDAAKRAMFQKEIGSRFAALGLVPEMK